MSGIGANLAFSRQISLSGAAIVSAARALFPQDHAQIEELTQGLDELAILKAYGREILVITLPERLPVRVYQFALETGGWRDARRAMFGHRGHAIITAMGKLQGWREAVAAAKAVSIVACAITSRTPAVAALAESSQVLLPPAMFRDIVTAYIADNEPPSLLWVSARRHSDDPTMVLSYGLDRFVGREIELRAPGLAPEEIQVRVQCMAHYLLLNGPVIGDGDTFGSTPTEKFRVSYMDEGLRPRIPIYRLMPEVP